LLLRRAGGSGVAARLLVEDTTSMQLRLALSWFSGTYRSSSLHRQHAVHPPVLSRG
ncbi:hypothetical protein X777_13135, partial [Ooceraea biroi]